MPALAIDFAQAAKEKYGVQHLDELWPELRELSYGGVPLAEAQRAELLRMDRARAARPDRIDVDFSRWRGEEHELPGGGLLINDA